MIGFGAVNDIFLKNLAMSMVRSTSGREVGCYQVVLLLATPPPIEQLFEAKQSLNSKSFGEPKPWNGDGSPGRYASSASYRIRVGLNRTLHQSEARHSRKLYDLL